MADNTQILADLAVANDALTGIESDISALEAIIAVGGASQEVADGVAALRARLTAVDATR